MSLPLSIIGRLAALEGRTPERPAAVHVAREAADGTIIAERVEVGGETFDSLDAFHAAHPGGRISRHYCLERGELWP